MRLARVLSPAQRQRAPSLGGGGGGGGQCRVGGCHRARSGLCSPSKRPIGFPAGEWANAPGGRPLSPFAFQEPEGKLVAGQAKLNSSRRPVCLNSSSSSSSSSNSHLDTQAQSGGERARWPGCGRRANRPSQALAVAANGPADRLSPKSINLVPATFWPHNSRTLGWGRKLDVDDRSTN